MNPYPSYKESGIEWIGEIPCGWLVSRLDFLCLLKGRLGWKSLKSDEYVDDGFIFLSTPNLKNKDIDYQNVNYITEERYLESPEIILENDDVLLVKDGSTLGIVNIVKNLPRPSTVNSSIGVLKNKSELLESNFLYYFLSSYYCQNIINRIKGGMGVPHLFQSDIKKFVVLLPKIQEQQQISNYLDHKTQQIDSLIEKTQQKIELLKEQRTSLINHVVTKGLNPDVEMKDSGVEWIGEIPISWEVTQIRFISEMMRGKFSHRPRNDERFYGGDYPFIQTGDIVSSGKFLTNFTQTLNEMGYSVSKEFPINTLVMSISGNIGDVSILKIKSCFPDSIIGFFPQKNTLIEYLFYLFLSLKDEFLKNSTVSTQMNLNVERVSSIRVPITSIQEQQQIVDYLDEQTQKIDTTIEKETQRIELLKEYRQSLISQVVTGKIDIHDEVLV